MSEFNLFQHQKVASQKIQSKKKCIFYADCRFGKTHTAMDAALKSGLPIFVVCPASVKYKFVNAYFDLSGLWKTDGSAEIEVVSWSKCKNLAPYDKNRFLIVDEAHRNWDFHAIQTGNVIRAARAAKRVVLMSATPSQKDPLDLYWPLKICGAWDVGKNSKNRFIEKFCSGWLPWGSKTFKKGPPSNQKELSGLLDSVCVKGVSPHKQVVKLYRKVWDCGFHEPPKDIRHYADFLRIVGNTKLELFYLWLKDKKLKEPAIVFAHHREVVLGLAEMLNCPYIIGGMSSHKKKKAVEEFETGDQGILVVSIGAGGEGLDIEYADRCYFLEFTYSPAKDKQAYMRMASAFKDKEIRVNYFMLKDEVAWLRQQQRHHYLNEVFGKEV